MKRLILVVVGLAAGFAAGSWTPLGEMALDGSRALVAKSERLSALLGTDRNDAPSVEALSPLDLKIQSMAVAVTPAEETLDRWQALTTPLLEKTKPLLKGRDPRLAAFSDDQSNELAILIAAIEEENRHIQQMLYASDAGVPETHLLRSIYESNGQSIALFQFFIALNNNTVAPADLAMLAINLDAQRRKINEATFMGRTVTTALRQAINLAPATTEHESNQKALALDFIDSYEVSYTVEDTLAERIADFPAILSRGMQGEDISAEMSAWDLDTQKLINDRGLLRIYRHNLAARMQGVTS